MTVGRSDYGRLGLGEMDEDVLEFTEIKRGLPDKIDSIGVGGAHSMAISDNGELYTWGYGDQRQLGQRPGEDEPENPKDEWIPKKVNGNSMGTRKVLQCAGGAQHTVILTEIDEQ
eukprot:TRINITY_DN3591_c0_g1_i1.p3 TRINITY_DN3591_c0_g1~~TRINITY_DN3591_c0_g1_i1.p3  ORF type:complete len:115 (-),score=38.08 TRINITY_DN3591_c0_g1_i1:352-696(-)